MTIKPCPYCASKAGAVLTRAAGLYWHHVECSNEECRATGPERGGEAEAIAAWNTRAELERLTADIARMGEAPSYHRGFYDALDCIMNYINSLDSGDMTARDVRSAIYGKALELRPVRAALQESDR